MAARTAATIAVGHAVPTPYSRIFVVARRRRRLIDPVAEHRVHEHRQIADEGRDRDGRRGDLRRDAEFGLHGEVRALAQEHRNAHQKQQDHQHRAVRADRQDQENAQSNNAGGLAENLLFGNGLERLVGENAAKRAADPAAAIGTDRADARGNDGGHAEHVRAVQVRSRWPRPRWSRSTRREWP